jgi:alkylation response protein AidB-like acyl-CoA dehydrogenase
MSTAVAQDLVGLARDIGPALRRNAELADRERRLPQESLDLLREAGFLRLYVPRALGGLEADPVTHARVQEELARHDSAAGWVLQVTSSSAWWCSRLPTETVEEIYGDGPDQMIAVSFGTPVEGVAHGDGLRISGQRAFASNVSEAGWIWLTALTVEDGRPVMVGGAPVVRAVFFPAGEASVVDTWDTLGMRGTDSNDVVVTDVLVPGRRSFRIGIDHTPGRHYGGALYRAPITVLVASYAPAVALGIAREAVDELVALAGGKTPFASATPLRQRPMAQAKLGRAEGALRSARSYLYDRITWGWERTLAGQEIDLRQRTEGLLAAVNAIDAAVTVVDLMYSAAGTSAIYKRNRLERLFRDAQVMRQHGFLNDSRYETVGQVFLGLPPDLGFVAL